MAHTLPVLPYALDALEPHISRQTLEFHHGKHHAGYVNNLNKLVEGTDLDGKSIEDTITAVAGNAEKAGVFNNAAQVWNHSFYWQCIKPGGGGQPTGALADKINADFGSFEKFIEAFKAAGATQFGSGWAWLVLDTLFSQHSCWLTANGVMQTSAELVVKHTPLVYFPYGKQCP